MEGFFYMVSLQLIWQNQFNDYKFLILPKENYRLDEDGFDAAQTT
jgi:hypothetical protein